MQSFLQSIIYFNPIKYTKVNNGKTIIATFGDNIINGNRAHIDLFKMLEQRSGIRTKHENYYKTVYLNKLKGKATYNPKDKHIAGLTYKLARKRLLLATIKLLKREFIDYYDLCLNDSRNSLNVIQNLSKQERKFKKDIKHIVEGN